VRSRGQAKEGFNRDQVLTGIACILFATFIMALSDALIKLVSSSLTVWQVFIVRSLIAMPCLVVLARWQGTQLRPVETGWVLLRSLLLVLAWLAYYAALPVLSLSVAAVTVYTNPIMTALLSALLLRDSVTPRQWSGVLLGFVGVAVILQPGADDFSWAILLPLLAAALYSCAMILTRAKCEKENAVSVALGLHVSFIAAGMVGLFLLAVISPDVGLITSYPFLLDSWPTISLPDWRLLGLLGIGAAAFSVGVAKAYQIAPPQIIATFDYGYLVWAVIWSAVIFTEPPRMVTVMGMALITIAGLLVASRPVDVRE